MNFFERRFIPLMYKAIRSQIKAFVSDMKANGVDEAKRNLDRVVINAQVYTTVSKIYKTVGVFFANDNYRKIIEQVKEQKQFGFNQEWIDAILNYFKEYLLNKATFPITATTKEQIRQVLSIGEQNGWGVDEMARELLKTEITLMRARMIVRTENAKAAFVGRKLGRDKAPYKTVRGWMAANDHRTRHSHHQVDDVMVNEGQKYSVPRYKKVGKVDVQVGVDMMEGPGDPAASKENVINCRCTEYDRVVFDENENPVMKRQNEFV